MAHDGQKSPGPRVPKPALKTRPSLKTSATHGSSQHGSSAMHTSSTLGDSEVDFALGALEALDTIVSTLIRRYEHRSSSNYYCRLLRGNIAEFRVWLEHNRKKADPSYLSEGLAVLEDICKGESTSRPRPAQPPTRIAAQGSEKYPELSNLALKHWHKNARDAIEKLYFDSGAPRVNSTRSAKQQRLHQRFHNVLSKISTSESQGVVEPQLAANEKEDDFSAHLSTLYTVLSRYSTCQASSTDIIPKISLSGYRRHEASGSIFDMLFPDHPHQGRGSACNWQNAVIHVGPEVTFDDNPEQTTATGIDYHEFCGTISNQHQEQLFLTVSKKDCRLHQSLRPDSVQGDAWMLTDPASPGMSLREILVSGELRSSHEAHTKLRTILFYLLVKGVWQFYDSELMHSEWTKDTVEFLVEFRDRNGALTTGVFLNQPLVSAEFHPPSSKQSPVGDARGPHRYPKIRELGIMLLEILFGREIDSFRAEPEVAVWLPGGQVRPYTDHSIAKWLYKKKVQTNDDILKPLRDVVGRCLEDEAIKTLVASSRKTDKSGATRMSLLREAIHELLVMPLESMILVNYNQPYDVKPLLQHDIAVSVEPSNAVRPGYCQHNRYLGPRELSSRVTTPETFDPHAEISLGDINLSRRWLDDLDNVQGLLQDADGNSQKSKVVILDTGFSAAHGDLQFDIEPGNYRDFVDGADGEPRDLTGHGTTIARLILHVLNDVDLYVGRIYRTEKTADDSFELLEKGIKWAVEKDADILVIATGTHVKAHDGVRAAINTLPDKVIVIAAAGNRDHCERVIFPARMPRVMCTYATTPRNYVLRTLNPNPRTNAYNFGILGIAIQPEGWDTPLTGTSYAAAIAAALAAGLLNFSRQAVRDGERKLNLEGYEKMNVIFEELARDNTDQGYSCIVPWRMLHILEEGTGEEHRRRIREYFADLILQRM